MVEKEPQQLQRTSKLTKKGKGKNGGTGWGEQVRVYLAKHGHSLTSASAR